MNETNPPPVNISRANQQTTYAGIFFAVCVLLIAASILVMFLHYYLAQVVCAFLALYIGRLGFKKIDQASELRKPLPLVSHDEPFQRQRKDGASLQMIVTFKLPASVASTEVIHEVGAAIAASLASNVFPLEPLPLPKQIEEILKKTIASEVDELRITVLRLNVTKFDLSNPISSSIVIGFQE